MDEENKLQSLLIQFKFKDIIYTYDTEVKVVANLVFIYTQLNTHKYMLSKYLSTF